MPFLGRDWRSPGIQWVKTDEGWESLKMWRFKMLENLSENLQYRYFKLLTLHESDDLKELCPISSQPFVMMRKISTREANSLSSLSEVFTKLDMSGAIKDRKRSSYVCKILQLLVGDHLSSLSGTAQRQVFLLLEDFITNVVKTGEQVGLARAMLDSTEASLSAGVWNHVGSNTLWEKHSDCVQKLRDRLMTIDLHEKGTEGNLTISNLPDDCIRHILSRLSDHRDILHLSMTETRNYDLCHEQHLWKNLCLFHFNCSQLSVFLLPENINEISTEDEWHKLYMKLVKRFGQREIYAEVLHMCRHCDCLFWELHGHRCLVTIDVQSISVPLSPSMVIQLLTS